MHGDTMNTETINKTIVPGLIDGSNIYIKIEFEKGKLSISGNCAGSGGQISDMLSQITEYSKGFNPENVAELQRVWDAWHLNDMRAGCEHQRALMPDIERLNPDFFNASNYSEIISGSYFAKCPECSHKYGSAWLKEEVPKDVLKFLAGLGEYELDGSSSHEDQANRFLKDTETTIKTEFLRHGKHFEDDTHTRDIYEVTMTRGDREYKFNFGQSIINSGVVLFHTGGKRTRHTGFIMPDDLRKKAEAEPLKKRRIVTGWMSREHFSLHGLKFKFQHPTAYNVLACLQKSDPESFDNFCSEFGYDTDSKQAEKTHQTVRDEWLNVERLFTESEIVRLWDIN